MSCSESIHTFTRMPTWKICLTLDTAASPSRNVGQPLQPLSPFLCVALSRWWAPPVRRIPSVLMRRLLADLEPFLVTRSSADGTSVLAW